MHLLHFSHMKFVCKMNRGSVNQNIKYYISSIIHKYAVTPYLGLCVCVCVRKRERMYMYMYMLLVVLQLFNLIDVLVFKKLYSYKSKV